MNAIDSISFKPTVHRVHPGLTTDTNAALPFITGCLRPWTLHLDASSTIPAPPTKKCSLLPRRRRKFATGCRRKETRKRAAS